MAGPFWAGSPADIIATHARTALPETARLPPDRSRHRCCRRARQRGSPVQRLGAKTRRSWICSDCVRINIRTSPSVTSRVPSLSTIGRASLADHRQTVFIGWRIRTTASSVIVWHGGSPLIREHLALRHLGPACGASQLRVFLALGDLDCSDTHELFTDRTDPDRRWQRPVRLGRRHRVILSAFRYAARGSGGLPLTTKIRSLCTAAAVQVRASSMKASFSSWILD